MLNTTRSAIEQQLVAMLCPKAPLQWSTCDFSHATCLPYAERFLSTGLDLLTYCARVFLPTFLLPAQPSLMVRCPLITALSLLSSLSWPKIFGWCAVIDIVPVSSRRTVHCLKAVESIFLIAVCLAAAVCDCMWDNLTGDFALCRQGSVRALAN